MKATVLLLMLCVTILLSGCYVNFKRESKNGIFTSEVTDLPDDTFDKSVTEILEEYMKKYKMDNLKIRCMYQSASKNNPPYGLKIELINPDIDDSNLKVFLNQWRWLP